MSFSFHDAKALARRAVHDTLAGPALYRGPAPDGAPDDFVPPVFELAVRWHNRLDRSGIGDEPGYAAVLEGINRVVFDQDELATKGLTLERLGRVTLVKFGTVFRLDTREPSDGPINEVWSVVPV